MGVLAAEGGGDDTMHRVIFCIAKALGAVSMISADYAPSILRNVGSKKLLGLRK